MSCIFIGSRSIKLNVNKLNNSIKIIIQIKSKKKKYKITNKFQKKVSIVK